MKDEEDENINGNLEDDAAENSQEEQSEALAPSGEHHFYENDEDENDTITKVTGMYKDWFLDYASYVILERAVPAIEDGFKPVQRRIMHSLKELDDGRYNKVANVVGHTMQYHPHGDASIGDAMVQIRSEERRVGKECE
jgi:topoisomerase-4 subunit A